MMAGMIGKKAGMVVLFLAKGFFLAAGVALKLACMGLQAFLLVFLLAVKLVLAFVPDRR